MKLEVPFYGQTTAVNCGPVALQMVFSYFGKNYDISLIEEKVGIKEGKGISTISLAIASAELGFKTEFFTKHLLFQESHLKKPYYQKYSSMSLEISKKLAEEAKNKGVKLYEKTISLEELLSKIKPESIPIALIDWNTLKKKSEKGYQGHFVPVVGYDKENVYFHNQGFSETAPFFKVGKNIFDKARKSDGTDEDIVVIHKK